MIDMDCGCKERPGECQIPAPALLKIVKMRADYGGRAAAHGTMLVGPWQSHGIGDRAGPHCYSCSSCFEKKERQPCVAGD